eukprot:899770_1
MSSIKLFGKNIIFWLLLPYFSSIYANHASHMSRRTMLTVTSPPTPNPTGQPTISPIAQEKSNNSDINITIILVMSSIILCLSAIICTYIIHKVRKKFKKGPYKPTA